MLYPAYVHPGDGDTAFGIQFPDFPGCFSAADSQNEIPANAQEAVEAHFADGEPVPPPSTIARWADSADYADGFWMLIDIDLRKVSSKAVRLNISLPDYLVQRIDAAASARRLSRSAFLAVAAEHEMEKA
ncbi:type II toxin-antitoxin system HicB family antitoxin [Robbsia andropogonis]|uniref:type II toxin-antitoxin system HicB family antitoxin n=1 Tax=Robbsia andropogonis TaxID=28092 RepID=UPI0020A22D0D|nr:type II toxin-antitoxin system HicB family antitoxin [Robbsia andropogonis]MCP1121582.1 type II toxin-antitoxin system HicB family antitoxin [Robbsia andropogonis]MCP1131410.1 type II toxin-antitoxin system HicB family antitoxin [Robbsia andropogonis]